MAGPVRHAIDVVSLEAYVKENAPVIKVPLEIRQFSFGQSNPTYQLTASNGQRYVLRKKPSGALLSRTAHKVEREYRVLQALQEIHVPVPRVYCLCEDVAVIGTPFYIMEFVDGRIFEDPALPGVGAQDRVEMWRSAVLTLASLHRVSPASISLQDYGKSSGFYARQLQTLRTISTSQALTADLTTGVPVGPIPHFDALISFFQDGRTQPPDRASLIHGDYKIDNLVYHVTQPRVIGILDWEMSTIGHPLSDLANLFFGAHVVPAHGLSVEPVVGGGRRLPPRELCLKWYADAVGWDPAPYLPWADAFAALRTSVIAQGIAARYALRQASSERAREYGRMMGPYGKLAWRLVRELRDEGNGSKEKAKI